MKNNRRAHSIDTVFVLALFCVFAASVLLTLIFGTRAYSSVKTSSDEAYYRRTALSYITEKLRQNDISGGVSLGEFGGSPALILHNTYDEIEYETYIYTYGGKVCELFCEADLDLTPEAGNAIIEGRALSFESVGGSLIKITYTDPEGLTGETLVYLGSGGATA